MSKYTKGPWGSSAALSSDPYHIRYISGPDGQDIAQVRSGFKHVGDNEFDQEEALANALLIKAAPEMFEALQACKNWMEWLDDPRSNLGDTHKAHIKMVIKVLNKAEGLK